MLTNDYEPRIIIRSCIEVMLEYYRRNSLVSFGFVAANDLEKDIKGKKINLSGGSRRFRFYQRMMVNLFGPETFYVQRHFGADSRFQKPHTASGNRQKKLSTSSMARLMSNRYTAM